MRNPFPSLPSHATLNLNPFARDATNLESAGHPHSHSRSFRRRARSNSRSTSHSQPVSLSTGVTSYASAFRTPLPVLSRTETICLEGMNVKVREQGGMMYVEAPVSMSPRLESVSRKGRDVSGGKAFETGASCAEHEKIALGGVGLGVGGDSGDEELNEERQAKIRALLEKYDPGEGTACPMSAVEDHREMVGQMFLDCILIAAGRLRRHGWIMGSKNECYRSLCTHERWDTIHEDLMRYTKVMKAYEAWRKCSIRSLEFGPSSIPLRCHSYGRTLAVIECATKSEDPEEVALAYELSQSLMHSHATWWRSHTFSRRHLDCFERAKKNRTSLGSRIALATFGGMALIFPMLIMVLDPGQTSRLVTTSIFTFAVGWILAYWVADASQSGLVAMAAAYAAVLVVFVGSGADH